MSRQVQAMVGSQGTHKHPKYTPETYHGTATNSRFGKWNNASQVGEFQMNHSNFRVWYICSNIHQWIKFPPLLQLLFLKIVSRQKTRLVSISRSLLMLNAANKDRNGSRNPLRMHGTGFFLIKCIHNPWTKLQNFYTKNRKSFWTKLCPLSPY